MTTAPLLRISNPNKDFLVCTDASTEGLGGVVTQERHTICYESRKLKEHEKSYVVHDMELEAIIHAFKIWRHYLMGNKFLLLIDNVGLKYLFDQKILNAWQARWLAFLSEYDFEIKHIKGKENIVVDALSWKQHDLYTVAISIYE